MFSRLNRSHETRGTHRADFSRSCCGIFRAGGTWTETPSSVAATHQSHMHPARTTASRQPGFHRGMANHLGEAGCRNQFLVGHSCDVFEHLQLCVLRFAEIRALLRSLRLTGLTHVPAGVVHTSCSKHLKSRCPLETLMGGTCDKTKVRAALVFALAEALASKKGPHF